MNVEAWCGKCGEGYRLAQIIEEGTGGRCPRCGIVYNHEYNALVTSTASQAIAAAAALEDAAQKLADIAPLLHIDREALYKALDTYLDR